MRQPVWIVGIGADGWAGLSDAARAAIAEARVVIGSARQLGTVSTSGEQVVWPSPLLPALPGLLETHRERGLCVLASGDPMFFGIGSSIAELLGPHAVRVIPHVSSVSLACARLGWALQDVEIVSIVGRPVDALARALSPGRRLLVLGEGPDVAALLRDRGYGASRVRVLENLGGPDERIVDGVPSDPAALALVAVECDLDDGALLLPVVPGLPDDAFEHDGQITKREARASALSRLAPVPGALLWDVGAGSGSIAIEWMRTHPSSRAIAVERRPDRAQRIAANAGRLGVPSLLVVTGTAPEALKDLDAPDAIFVGGGASEPGVIEACWDALPPGGRIVAHAVTLESEAVLRERCAELGGELTRLSIERAEPLGGYTTWRPALPVVQWAATR